jgi:hypothetical protein
MRHKLGLVGRHIDRDGAIAFAALAGKTEMERLPDLLALPAVLDNLALQHLKEQPRAAAR